LTGGRDAVFSPERKWKALPLAQLYARTPPLSLHLLFCFSLFSDSFLLRPYMRSGSRWIASNESPIRHLLRPGACFVTGVAIHKSGLVKA
jgi:hypothetical protein